MIYSLLSSGKRNLSGLLMFTLILFSVAGHAREGKIAGMVEDVRKDGTAFQGISLFSGARSFSPDELIREALRKGTVSTLETQSLASLMATQPEAILVKIPFDNSSISIELIKSNLFTENFSVVTSGEGRVDYRGGAYYRGIIEGDPSSVAAFSFFNDEVYGVVSSPSLGNIVIGRIQETGNTNEYIIYADQDLIPVPQMDCRIKEEATTPQKLQQLLNHTQSATTNCVKFFYEIDNDIFLSNGSSTTTTTNWMTAVHNNVATLYSNDNINTGLNQIFIWTTSDPYTGLNSSDQLDLFHQTRLSFDGDVGQLVAMDGGGNGGLADAINGLCTPWKYSYSDVSFTYNTVPLYSWTINVIAHEFGHLLGSPHTHNCSWPGGAIDNCGPTAGYPTEGGCADGPPPPTGGTIMSYCHLTGFGINFSNGFGTLPATAIQNAVDMAPCLGPSCVVCTAPAHNSCATPQPLNISASCTYLPGNLCAATESQAPATCSGSTAADALDLWYSITPSQSSITVRCQSGMNTDVVVAIYSGACGSLSLLQCVDATNAGGLEQMSVTVTPGTPYLIRVYDFNGNTSGTDFGICVTAPCVVGTNNSCSTPTALTIGSTCSYLAGDLCLATQSIAPTTCSGFQSASALDLWYTITPASQNVRISAQSGFNTDVVLALYSGTCGAMTLIHCTDTTSTGGLEVINGVLTIGATYYIRVWDYNNNNLGTDFQICAYYTGCVPPNAPASVNATSTLICNGQSTTVSVTGTLTLGATWEWYTTSCGTGHAGSGTSLNVSPTGTTIYYVRAELNNCYSECDSVTIAVNQIPNAPVSASATTPVLCTGGSTDLTVSGSLSPGATWHWYSSSCGGTAVGTGSTINVSPSSTTTYFVRAQNGNCFSVCQSVVVTVNSAPAAPTGINATSTSVCSGGSVTLTATGTLAPGATWVWRSGTCGGTQVGTGSSINVTPVSTTTYFLRAEIGACVSTCESVTITIVGAPNAPTSAGVDQNSICSGTQVTLSATGTLSGGAVWQWYSGSCGGTPVGQGASLNVTPSATTTYFVRGEAGSCVSTCQSVTVTVTAAPSAPTGINASSTSVCSGGSVTLNATGTLTAGATWVWRSGTCGGTQVGTGSSLIVTPASTTTYFLRAENGSCVSTCESVTVTIVPSPNAPVAANVTQSNICSGTQVTLSVTGTLSAGATWQWYSGSCGGASVGQGASLNIIPSATTTYFVRGEAGSCASACQSVTVTVNAAPSAPVSATATNTSICQGTSTTLSVTGTLTAGASWVWHTGNCNGTVAGTGASLAVTPSTTTTYFVRAENANCVTTCQSVTITVSPQPAAPTAATATQTNICSGISTTLNVTGTLTPGATWQWYSGSCGGTPIGQGTSVSVNPVSTTTYFVRGEAGNCVSVCQSITINVTLQPGPATSIIAGNTTLCAGSSTTLIANGILSAGATWVWRTGSCGGTVAGNGPTLPVTPSTTTTYYLRAENGNCVSSCQNITITVNPQPAAPVSASATQTNVCSGTTVTLSVNGTLSPGATWEWYVGSCSGINIDDGASIDVTPTSTTTYFVRAEDGNCFSACQTVTVTVGQTPLAPVSINTTAQGICAGGSATLSVTGTLSPGAQWVWRTGSCTGTTIGQGVSVSVSPTVNTTYFVRAENGNCVSACESITITSSQQPNDPVSAGATQTTICEGSSTTLNVTGTLITGATWEWYSGSCGGTPVGSGASLAVTPSVTTTYFVRGEAGGCFSGCQTVTVNVNPSPAAPDSILASSTAVCAGSTVTLLASGSLSTGADWVWRTGNCNGTVAGQGDSLVIVPTGTVTYFLRSENGTCNSPCESVTISLVAPPNDPTAASATDLTVCSGETTILTVTGTLPAGVEWQWYEGSCGTSAVGQGDSLAVSPLTTTTYFVRGEAGLCVTNCESVTITVTPSPLAPVSVSSSDPFICSSSPVTLTVSGTLSPGADWNWRESSCGASSFDQGTSVVVNPTVTTTYYVNADDGVCVSVCDSITIVVGATPADPDSILASSTSVCANSIVTLTADGTLSPNSEWYWYTDSCSGTPVDTGAFITVGPAVTTTYFVRSEDGPCVSNCKQVTVTVNPAPATPVISQMGDTLTSSPASTYQWYFSLDGIGYNPISGASTQELVTSVNAYYFVEITSIDGCIGYSDTTFYVFNVSVEELAIVNVSVYPNPSHGLFNYEITGNDHHPVLTVFDATGRLLIREEHPGVKGTVDLSGFAAGMYFLTIESNDGRQVLRLILQ